MEVEFRECAKKDKLYRFTLFDIFIDNKVLRQFKAMRLSTGRNGKRWGIVSGRNEAVRVWRGSASTVLFEFEDECVDMVREAYA